MKPRKSNGDIWKGKWLIEGQAIAFGELQKSENEELVRQAVESAKTLAGDYEGISVVEYVSLILMLRANLQPEWESIIFSLLTTLCYTLSKEYTN